LGGLPVNRIGEGGGGSLKCAKVDKDKSGYGNLRAKRWERTNIEHTIGMPSNEIRPGIIRENDEE